MQTPKLPSENLLQILEFTDIGYRPMIDYGAWRVAILNYIDELLPDRLATMQRHDETDEVFVLLKGRCILFMGEGADSITSISAVDMQPHKLYNVRRSCWHTHTLDPEAMVLIIENRDTVSDNSPLIALSPKRQQEIVDLTNSLWK